MPFFVLGYFIIFTFLPGKRAPHAAHVWSRTWAKFLAVFLFLRLKVEGKEKIDPQQTYVFVANHRSQLDIPLYALACRNTFRFLAKEELTRIPLMGYVIKRLYLTVNRE